MKKYTFTAVDLQSGTGSVQPNPEWFDKMSAKSQQFYLSRHPHSAYHLTHRDTVQNPTDNRDNGEHDEAPVTKRKVSFIDAIHRAFTGTDVESIRSKVKQHVKQSDVDELDRLASDSHSEEHEDVPLPAVHIIKKIVMASLIAAGAISAALVATHAAVLLGTAAAVWAHANGGGDLYSDIWQHIKHKNKDENTEDLITNKLYNAYGSEDEETSDHNLSRLVQEHR